MFNNAILNEYIWSSLITFITAFMVTALPTIGALPMNKSAIFALIAVAVRAGFRAVLNLLATKFNTVSSVV